MINKNYIVVFDLETDGSNPKKCNPIQIAALAIEPRSLTIVPGSEFSSMCCPEDIDQDYYIEYAKDTIQWHANNHKISWDEMFQKIKESPSEKETWKNFLAYLKQWHIPGKPKSKYTAPILAGYNIFEFDKVIIDRLANKYKNLDSEGIPNFYQKRDTIDILKLVFAWSENLTALSNYKMDTLREVFGINSEGVAHEALKDCYDEAAILIKYLRLHRKLSQKVQGWK